MFYINLSSYIQTSKTISTTTAEFVHLATYTYITHYKTVEFIHVNVLYLFLLVPAVELSTSSIIDPTYAITVTNNTLSSYTNIITSSMADKITETTINSSMINTSETFEHGSNIIPVILAFVFGGILGLCIVVCIVGLILRRQKKKRQNKHHGFTLAASNPLFDK